MQYANLYSRTLVERVKETERERERETESGGREGEGEKDSHEEEVAYAKETRR